MLLRGNQRDRWLLTYADFITLLFATFVLMYATAKAKEQRTPPPHCTAPIIVGPPAVMPKPQIIQSNLLTDLQKLLISEQQSGILSLTTEQRGIVIAIDDKTCFLPGQADVQAATIPVFDKVANVLSQYGNRVLLEGHTDSTPIHNSQFGSNWELSTARSIAVMKVLEGHAVLQPERFLIGGSADNAPVSSNETEQGRRHNRRVEIVVLDNPSPAMAPVAAVHPMAAVSQTR